LTPLFAVVVDAHARCALRALSCCKHAAQQGGRIFTSAPASSPPLPSFFAAVVNARASGALRALRLHRSRSRASSSPSLLSPSPLMHTHAAACVNLMLLQDSII